MNLTRGVRVVACIGVALFAAAAAEAQSSPVNDQITQQEQKLAEARAAHRTNDEGVQLISRKDAKVAGLPQPGFAY